MEPLTAAQVRRRYLEFFAERGHVICPSDSLVPANDPTLLFTGAGMNQFKDMFLGKGALPHKRVTTAQKCLRVPDLDNVGLTPRHHTFFEMLGNFSFGDYFKAECIPWEWEFFKDACGIPPEQMVVTIYSDDDEAFEIWTQRVGIAPDRLFRFDEKENFWPAEAPSKGPNGPCGPCSEIYFDNRPDEPGPDQQGLQELPADRFTEIGNCVFTQFDRRPDGSLQPLPQKNIDVGLGLERIAAVLQGADNNFETELFKPFLEHLAAVSGNAYGADQQRDIRMRRIADHIRAVTFCIADGALPGNEGRGYVVRKILRRAARDGFELGLEKPFLFEMVDVTGEVMGDQYPEVREHAAQCRAMIKSEEENFLTVYRQGMLRLHGFLKTAEPGRSPAAGKPGPTAGSGEFAFTLHDTYGFPVDITQKVMEEHGLLLDADEFDAAMAAQRARARASMATTDAVFTASVAVKLREAGFEASQFTGYDADSARANLQALVGEGDVLLDRLATDQRAVVVASATPFYAQGGGQVGDRGVVRTATGEAVIANTTDRDGFHLHEALVTHGHLEAGQECELLVDKPARRATERNHTATHLLHAALKQALGEHVSQAGSEVAPDRLRFDYTQPNKPSTRDLRQVEDLVNEQIVLATPVQAVVRGLGEARARGFVALFGEKYGNEVRTLQVGDFSKELCGGTHVANSGNIGAFRITAETAISAGTRRLEAVTGPAALLMARGDRDQLAAVASQLKIPIDQVGTRVAELGSELKKLRKELDAALAPDLGVELDKLRQQTAEHDGVRTVLFQRPGMSTKDCQELVKRAQQALAPLAAVVLSTGRTGEVAVVASVSAELTGKITAPDLVKAITAVLGGGGGGRPEMAQGKGAEASKLTEAVAQAAERLRAVGLV